MHCKTVHFFLSIMKHIEKVRDRLLQIYLLLLLVGVPLYYVDTYVRISTMKWIFYRAITVGFSFYQLFIPGILVLVLILNVLIDKSSIKKISNPFLGIYILCVIVSFIMMDDKTLGLEGYKGWYMGLFAQISFFVIYITTKKHYKDLKVIHYCVLLSSGYIAFLVILNRFGIYPFGISRSFDAGMLRVFVSTIGNANWFASYLMIIVGVGFGSYILAKKNNQILFGIWCSVLFASLLLQNSESVYFSLFVLISGSLLMTIRKKEYFLRVIELLIIMSISFLFVGCLYILFPDYGMELDVLSHAAKNPLLNIVFIIICVVIWKYLQIRIWDTSKMYKTVIGCLIGVIALILLLLKLKNSSFLIFDDAWGTHRGMVWRVTVESWLELWKKEPLKAIFGVGPDAYISYVYSTHAETLASYFYTQVVTNAHNEWLTAFINYGLIGGLSYILFFLSRLRYAIKNRNQIPATIIEACMILAYMANNLFSFQSIVATPLLFALLGMFDQQQVN